MGAAQRRAVLRTAAAARPRRRSGRDWPAANRPGQAARDGGHGQDRGRTGVVRMLDDKGRILRDAAGNPVEGDVYVGCLGRVARTPRAMDDLRAWADEVHGEVQVTDDRQYLGYRVSCHKGDAQVDVEVTGAASRMPPADLFDARTALLVAELGLIEAPPESGNVAAGFMATALQASNRAMYYATSPRKAADSPRAEARSWRRAERRHPLDAASRVVSCWPTAAALVRAAGQAGVPGWREPESVATSFRRGMRWRLPVLRACAARDLRLLRSGGDRLRPRQPGFRLRPAGP